MQVQQYEMLCLLLRNQLAVQDHFNYNLIFSSPARCFGEHHYTENEGVQVVCYVLVVPQCIDYCC